MLVLARRENETIVIDGGRITIRVIRIHGGQVRLGISAPEEITVHRAEVQARIDAQPTRPAGV